MKKAAAIFFTLLLLISNAGITLATHYCGGQAVKSELMIGHRHLDCGMPETDLTVQDVPVITERCCENDYQTFEVEDDYNPSVVKSALGNVIIPILFSFLDLSLSVESENPQYANYSPPLLLRDIPVLNQVFRI